MIAAVLLVLTVLAALCWLCASPARLGVAVAAVLAAHPAPTMAATGAVAVAVTVGAGVLAYRAVRAEGWHLVTVQRPNLAPVGGVAS